MEGCHLQRNEESSGTWELVANDTWELVEKPDNGSIIGCRTVLRNKYNADGSLEKRKARVVARDFSQRPGIDTLMTLSRRWQELTR